jgi:transcriptional regulator with XRE-family HTH domain
MLSPCSETLMSHVEYTHITSVSIGSHSGNVAGMTTIKTLAKYVEDKRLALGIDSQTELARRAGVPRETVNRIERGLTQNPEADVRRRLAKALGVSHLDLLVAAGEITEDEIAKAGASGVVERDPHDRREQLIERLRAVPDGYGVENSLENMLDIIARDIERRAKAR